ncbi:MAG: DUF167 domain-containing protein [Jiangellaceae bacterium]
MRVTVRVRPGASRTRVGGEHAGALVIAVTAPAVDGRATEAALRALADALGLRRRHVALVSGANSRTKVVEVSGPDDVEAGVMQLRSAGRIEA